MSKGLKFRAYIKHLKWITPVLSIDFKNEEVEVDISDGFGDTSFYRFDEIVLMQCTGLKDKRGREIYEGDFYKNMNGVIWKIYFDENTACCRADAINRDYTGACFLDTPDGEIIGNIYENPELLEVPV